jgi:hypothetical protein
VAVAVAKKLPPERGGGNRQRAIEARGTEFESRTNLGQSPNSQGTLFQGGKPVNEHRWPRGYSPTRMHDVKNAVAVTMTHSPDAMDMERHTSKGHHEMGHPYLNPDSPEHTKRLAREPIARSDHPIEDLASLKGIHLDFGARGANSSIKQNRQAYYDSSTKGVTINPMVKTHQGEYLLGGYAHPRWQGKTTGQDEMVGDHRHAMPTADATLMHEVGHHVDITRNVEDYGRKIRGNGGKIPSDLRGHMETQADTSMTQHFVNDPRNQRVTGHDVHRETYGQRGALPPAGYQDPSKFAKFTDHDGGDAHLLQGTLFGRNGEI